jgi:translin
MKPDRIDGTLIETTNRIIERMDEVNSARDRALNEGRQVVRLSANSIRAVHRGEGMEADRLINGARQLLAELVIHLRPFPGIYWAGYVQDAMKEFAEAAVTRAIVAGVSEIPTPQDLGVEDAPYLNALAEAASELRREVLDRMRASDLRTGEHLLARMDEIYDVLVTVDFPDAVTGGLRRTTDQLRAVLERTRGDLTMTLTQTRLESALRESERRISDSASDAGR